MRHAILLSVLALAFTLVLGIGQASAQEPPKVINVLAIDTGGDTDKFLEFAKRARQITEQHGGTGNQRVWLSTLAGPNTGSVVVAVEYPSMVSMAQSQAKVNSTPEWQKFVDDFQESGMGVRSNSLSFEITP
jgi:hypothetical protein